MDQDPLLLLRQSLTAIPPTHPTLLNDEAAADTLPGASHLKFFNGTTLSLSTVTRFTRSTGPVDLRTIFRAWDSRNLSITDYISTCAKEGVTNLTFLERTDLLTWLEGASDTSDYIPALESEQLAPKRSSRRTVSERMEEILKGERSLGGRGSILRGVKPTDFSHVRKEAYANFISNLRKKGERQAPSSSNPASSGTLTANPSQKKSKNRDPIIILSPSASSLINLSNIKAFLEQGSFTPPQPSFGSNLQTLSRTSARLGKLRFLVVDSVDRFKPDYWERVVAVFTTGQAWQFKEYKWSNPRELFQRVKGFVVTYVGDPQPSATLEWNVDNVRVERVRRHTDREVVEGMVWERLERFMESKGWGRR